MATILEGTGTKIWWWRSTVTPRLLPLDIQRLMPSPAVLPVMDRTHLLSVPPDELSEFGGREYAPGRLGDPGEIRIVAFYDPSRQLPQGIFIARIDYPLELGWYRPATVVGRAFFVNPMGAMTIEPGVDIVQELTMKLTGLWTRRPALRTKP